MNKIETAVDFLKAELRNELKSSSSFLQKIPDIELVKIFEFYGTLDESKRNSLLDYFARRGFAHHCWMIGIESYDNREAPSFEEWEDQKKYVETKLHYSAKDLRGIVGEYKIAKYQKRETYITEELFEYASTVVVPKAAEIRKAVKSAMATVGCYKIEPFGGGEYIYRCRFGECEFEVTIDYGGWYQLRYGIHFPTVGATGYRKFSVEKLFGLSFGGWNNITIQSLENSVEALIEAVTYGVNFPGRLRAAAIG